MTDQRAEVQTRTTRSLHGLAELVLAGPRYRQGGSIELRVELGGFRTRDEPFVAVRGSSLVTPETTVELDGLTFAEAADRIGLEASRLDDVYSDGPGIDPDEVVHVDPDAARQVEQAFAIGDQALRIFRPTGDPILWPEHFDVAIDVGELTFGVSPGDRYVNHPYAYVAWPAHLTSEFRNAPFGAARSLGELGDADRVAAFFREGSARVLAGQG